MPLPDGFNEYEHLLDIFRREHNKAVRAWFKNQDDNDVSTPKAGLKHACLIKDEDNVGVTQIRAWLFEIIVGRAQSIQVPIYGIPVSEHQRNVTFKPQVKLYFVERLGPNELNRTNPVAGEITFRLMDESSESYTRAKAEKMARDIKREFATPSIFIWEKGIYYYYYRDYERGYDLRLLVKSKAEGERVTKAVLGIQGHPFSDDNSDFSENTRNYPMNPGNQIVYGQSVPKPIKRPRVDVRFRYAQLFLHGRLKVINLVSTPEARLKEVIERLGIV